MRIMKVKKMNRIAKKYYRDLKLMIPIRGKQEKRLLQDVKLRLEELSETSSELTYEIICSELGEPKQFAAEYFSNVDSECILKKLRFSYYVRCLIICIIATIVITASIRSYYLYRLYLEVQDSIVTEKRISIE